MRLQDLRIGIPRFRTSVRLAIIARTAGIHRVRTSIRGMLQIPRPVTPSPIAAFDGLLIPRPNGKSRRIRRAHFRPTSSHFNPSFSHLVLRNVALESDFSCHVPAQFVFCRHL